MDQGIKQTRVTSGRAASSRRRVITAVLAIGMVGLLAGGLRERAARAQAGGCTTLSFAPARNFGAGDNPLSVTTADFNSDGKPDLATANNNSANVSVLLGDGAGGFAPAVNFAAGNNPRSVTTGDFNLVWASYERCNGIASGRFLRRVLEYRAANARVRQTR